MKRIRKWLSAVLCLAVLTTCMAGCAAKDTLKVKLDPDNPTTVTIWNYYNGDQLTAFENLVSTFNKTVGAEKGIVVVSVSQGSIDNLATGLLDAVEGKVGAADIPSAAAVYAETVYILNSKNAVVSLDDYFSKDELSEYVAGFLDEGHLTEGGALYLLPVSKSTECFVVNTTDWKDFADATGIKAESIDTYEKLAAAAKAYYEWTDAKTPAVAEDGKALYGRDSVANYVFVGAKQLGHELFKVGSDGKVTVDLDRNTFKTLWDNYYIPYINGYYASYASHRSEDIKTGAIVSMTGSTSGISYIPTAVTDANDVSHDIDVSVRKSLGFSGEKEPVYVQQGAGYCVMKTSAEEQYATTEFLKWFTDVEQNLTFSINSGYSPVKVAANDQEAIKNAFKADSPKQENMLSALLVSADVYQSSVTYTCRAFDGSKELRDVLEKALNDIAVQDRAAVLDKIKKGATRAEAVKSYETDAYFDTWFASLCKQVNSFVA